MWVLEARNVHQALPKALWLLKMRGVPRDSRNGPVIQMPGPVSTMYERPWERVMFWPERDANPAFHLYEAMWMLSGRNDLAPLLRYIRDFGKFSDDGETLYGAYGHRWRRAYDFDQLESIANMLRKDPVSRRAVLQIWQGEYDLDRDSKDLPCNLMVTFQISPYGKLDMVVFCRSNDLVWGAYGANGVHFGFLQEYMAIWIGVPIGTYTQVSVNWHAYAKPLELLQGLSTRVLGMRYAEPDHISDPYYDERVRYLPMLGIGHFCDDPIPRMTQLNANIKTLVQAADTGWSGGPAFYTEPFFENADAVLRAHHHWRTLESPQRFNYASSVLSEADQKCDWVVAMTEWIERRKCWVEEKKKSS